MRIHVARFRATSSAVDFQRKPESRHQMDLNFSICKAEPSRVESSRAQCLGLCFVFVSYATSEDTRTGKKTNVFIGWPLDHISLFWGISFVIFRESDHVIHL